MIYFLKGKVSELEPFNLILDVQDVGYKIKITLDTYEKLIENKISDVKIYTRLIYKEDSRTLYGFLSKEEAELFDFIREVHGIGPQLASNLISTLGIHGFLEAIESNNINELAKTPKIGKTKAEKILFELNQKSKKVNEFKNKIIYTASANKVNNYIDDYLEQIENPLLGLGFNKKEIENATLHIHKKETNLPERTKENLQNWIKIYLKYL